MTFLQSIILGIVQGITEFLPISSSAHLVLVPFILGWQFPPDQTFVFDVLVQMGTLLAVIIYFWKDLVGIVVAFLRGLFSGKPFAEEQSRLGWYLILATIPAGILGITIKDIVEAAFNSPSITALFLLVTAAFLLVAERVGRRSRKLGEMKWIDALWIGLGQALSIFPGISRSGSTISAGMTRHFDRTSAARFSFLMMVPVMAAAGVLGVLDLLKMPSLGQFLPVVLAGTLTSAVVGYLCIHWLLQFLNRRSLTAFAVYCLALAGVVLFFVYVL
ncbi:MAG TPA: undecaprenyl-diphosphatase UppP [Anaerolineaceae bacterium]|nr:undecaprenyl-diphosphatase UppP [Anaerolineaceae bacterium]